MFYVNGEEQAHIALSDRSFQYGDGCFTTMLIVDGHIQHWSLHQQRLDKALSVLNIAKPDWVVVQGWLKKILLSAPSLKLQYSGIKIHISRGCGGRGYNAIGADSPQITIHAFDYPTYYKHWQNDGVNLGISVINLGLNPLLAGIKHNNRLEQVLIKSNIEHLSYDDVVVCDLNHKVIETSASNLFWIKNDYLYTSDLSSCGVAGTMRHQVLQLAQSLSLLPKVGSYLLQDLLDADEIFISNALHGIVPVISIDSMLHSEAQSYFIGTKTRDFQEKLNP